LAAIGREGVLLSFVVGGGASAEGLHKVSAVWVAFTFTDRLGSEHPRLFRVSGLDLQGLEISLIR